MIDKKCTECRKTKVISEFYKEKKGALGVKSKCKECVDTAKKYYRSTNRNKTRCLNREYQRKQSYKEGRKRYNVENVDKLRASRRAYNDKNKKIIQEKVRMRYHQDVNFRLTQCLRKRVRNAICNRDKSARTLDLLGCTVDKLKQHLASLFKPDMTWSNYGHLWHMDHVLPCKMFNLQLESEQRKCFHYINIQPLWADENLKKAGSFDIEDDTLTSIYLLFEEASIE